jgi:hypothetical protein
VHQKLSAKQGKRSTALCKNKHYCESGMFIPDRILIFSHTGSRIQLQKEKEKKHFHNFHKIVNIYYFELIQKKKFESFDKE